MTQLRTLPKDYAILIFLAVTTALIIMMSIGFLIAGGVGSYFYLHDYPMSKVITYAIIAWVVYIVLLIVLLLRKKNAVQQKQNYLIHTVKSEIVATMALRSLNSALRNWKRKHDAS